MADPIICIGKSNPPLAPAGFGISRSGISLKILSSDNMKDINKVYVKNVYAYPIHAWFAAPPDSWDQLDEQISTLCHQWVSAGSRAVRERYPGKNTKKVLKNYMLVGVLFPRLWFVFRLKYGALPAAFIINSMKDKSKFMNGNSAKVEECNSLVKGTIPHTWYKTWLI